MLARDRSADGQFVYGVRSTGVFCRPSCASRRPRRDRVVFFDTTDAAERGGFRACRRCRPLDAAHDPWPERIRAACRAIARSDRPPTLASLARLVGGSPFHLQRTFKRMVGVSPREFAEARRFESVRQELRTSGDVTTAIVNAGYGSSSRFYERAAAQLGMTPSHFRKGGDGQAIRYATVASALGRVLVAATDAGVCAVSLGDSDTELVRALRGEFPRATLTEDTRALGAWTRQIVDHLAGRLPALTLPLDVRATAFQRQVWDVLRTIPPGETRTYAEIAGALGRPAAARAVARACASNPVALAVPCHRVVPAAGGVGGYRWGSARKQALLEREAPPGPARRQFR